MDGNVSTAQISSVKRPKDMLARITKKLAQDKAEDDGEEIKEAEPETAIQSQ